MKTEEITDNRIEQRYKPIKVPRASDLIVKEIWNLILSGKLKPGDKLPSERELVDKFQVSKVTLREALNKLEAYGHITKKRGQYGGSIVLDIAPSQGIKILLDYLKLKKLSLEQFIQARNSIEPIITETAANTATKEDIEELKEDLKKHEEDYGERGCSKCGWKFYLLLAKFTRNEIFIVTEELLVRLLLDFEFSIGISDLESTEDQDEYNKNTYIQQKKIAEAIMNKDPKTAKEEMIKLRTNWARIITQLYKRSKTGSADDVPR